LFRSFAAETKEGTSLQHFVDMSKLWQKEDALKIEVRRKTDTEYDFDVVRCRYAEMYREMGLGEIGHLLSCQRDGSFCEGYDPKLKMKRTQTIMQGASPCDFRYTYEAEAEAGAGPARRGTCTWPAFRPRFPRRWPVPVLRRTMRARGPASWPRPRAPARESTSSSTTWPPGREAAR